MSVRRTLLFPLSLLLALFDGCSCDPANVGDPDGGPADAGDIQQTDAGVPLSGALWLQNADGVLGHLDLATATVSWPLGTAAAQGAIATLGTDLLVFSPSLFNVDNDGALATVGPDTGEFSFHDFVIATPWDLATDGTEVAAVYGHSGTVIGIGPLDGTGEVPPDGTGSSVAYSTAGLLVGIEQGVYEWEVGPLPKLTQRDCGGLSVRSDGVVVCAELNGLDIVALETSGDVVINDDGGAEYNELTVFSDDTFAATREDCTVVTDRTDLAALPTGCPASFAEIGDRVFAGMFHGGVMEANASAAQLVIGGTAFADGLDAADGFYAVAGTLSGEHLLVVREDHTAPRWVAGALDVHAVALGDGGEVWALTNDTVRRAGPTDTTLAAVHTGLSGEALVRAGDYVYVRDGDTLKRFSLSDGPGYALETLSTSPGAEMGACGDSLLVFNEDDDEMTRLDADGTETVVFTGVFDQSDGVTAFSCVNNTLVISDDAGDLWMAQLGTDTTLTHLANAGGPVAFFAAASNSGS